MDLRYLRYFIAVVEEGSFTGAAQRLNTAQPSISQQIKKLEDVYVGTPLLRRDKHHVELTDAGRVFFAEAKAILDHVERAIDRAKQAARAEIGELTIGFVPGAEGKVFSHVLPNLRAECPGIRLTLRSLTTPEQLAALRDRTIDVAFLRGPVDDPSLECESVLWEEIVAAVPAQHEIARRERIPIAELAAIPFVQVSKANAPAVHEAAERISTQAGVKLNPVLETEGVLGTLNAIGSGLGFSLLPDYVRQISPATVAVRPLACDPAPQIELVAAYCKSARTSPLEIFLRFLRSWTAESESNLSA